MKKIGITGQTGFIGAHLTNYLNLFPEEFTVLPFEDRFFDEFTVMEDYVKQCDAVVHLAAMNRHGDPQVIYDTNIRLVKTLIRALESTGSKPHVLFSSSSQEERDNPYGKSKREGREMLVQWAEKNDAPFTGFVIPNVFGPFGNPFYNSVIATFCHQLTHGEIPKIDIDGEMKLIYVGELVEVIASRIRELSAVSDQRSAVSDQPSDQKSRPSSLVPRPSSFVPRPSSFVPRPSSFVPRPSSFVLRPSSFVPHTSEARVSGILALLEGYEVQYLRLGIIPELKNRFEVNLFNTFRCFMDIKNHFPVKYKQHVDDRGAFVETIKLHGGGQVSFSTTRPGITRGNHYHTRKIERFAVIKGKALIQLRRIGTPEIFDFYLDGREPAYVDMPIWYTHNIMNIGEEDLYTIFWINEFYNPDDPDTFFEKV